MKKLRALCLTLVMLMGISAPAEELAADLERVTLAVKNVLDIPDDFTDFSGDRSGRLWFLNWNGDQRDISVTATDDGTVCSLYIYDYEDDVDHYGQDFRPSFPDSAPESILEAAESFAERVLNEGEEWKFVRMISAGLDTGAGECRLSGRIEIGGMPSDVTAEITVNMENTEVTGFFRSDCYMEYAQSGLSGEINSDGNEAKALLMENMPLELRYYVSEYGQPAHLVYMPAFSGEFIVRAEDGELVNIDQLHAAVYAEESAAMDVGAGETGIIKELTEAERAGVSAYDGAMSVDQLEAAIRAMTELGVTEEYILHGADYYTMDGYVAADLNFARALSDEEVMGRYGLSQERIDELRAQGSGWYDTKNARMNAHTGEIEYFDTWRNGDSGRSDGAQSEKYREMVDGFIEKRMGNVAADIKLAAAERDESYFGLNGVVYEYTRMHGGYPFPDNYVRVVVNAADGTIDSIDKYWDLRQEFAADAPAISIEEAQTIYFGAMEYECAYISVPATQENFETVYERTPAWHFGNADSVYGVDALTGEALSYDAGAVEAIEYSDLEGVPQREMIEKLALYGVGFSGGDFLPEEQFTVSDMLTLILCMDGELGTEEMSHEDRAERARYLGAGDFSEDDPERGVSRAEFAKALVNMAGYGDAAALTGIYACGFSDEDDISDDDMGAVAIGYALGFVKTDGENRVSANSLMTRAQAAEMAHDFLTAEK